MRKVVLGGLSAVLFLGSSHRSMTSCSYASNENLLVGSSIVVASAICTTVSWYLLKNYTFFDAKNRLKFVKDSYPEVLDLIEDEEISVENVARSVVELCSTHEYAHIDAMEALERIAEGLISVSRAFRRVENSFFFSGKAKALRGTVDSSIKRVNYVAQRIKNSGDYISERQEKERVEDKECQRQIALLEAQKVTNELRLIQANS